MRAIPCPVSESSLRQMYHEQKLTDEEVAARIDGGTTKRVRAWRHRLGIETIPRWARHNVAPIEGRLQSLLAGSMLGDGRIVFQGTGSYYCESHSEAQRDYLEWKANIWGPTWVADMCDVPDKRGFKQVRMRTVTHGVLNEWRDLFYEARSNGWKRLIPRVVDQVDDFALAIWYLDDGHAGWWPGITFGADATSHDVALTIFEKFGLSPRWQPVKGNTGHFHMEREEVAHRFLELVRPHIPECMVYKLDLGFQGPHYQVRQKLSNLEGLVDDGMSSRQIGTTLGVGASTVTRHMATRGVVSKCEPSSFQRGADNRHFYGRMYPDHVQDAGGAVDSNGQRVGIRTASLTRRTDAHAKRWSFGLRPDITSHPCDVYSCLCLDEHGTEVVAEFRIPVSAVMDVRVIHISERYEQTKWAPYLVSRATPAMPGNILDMFG